MERLLLMMLSNVALAVAMAAVLLPLARMLRKPALSHAVCLLVLLKLLMPPVWNLPVVPLPPATEVPRKGPDAVVDRASAVPTMAEPEAWDSLAWGTIEPHAITDQTSIAPALAADVKREADPPDRSRSLALIILCVWAAGSVTCAVIILHRLLRLRRMLRSATLAPLDVQHRNRTLASRLGLRRGSPNVWFACGGVCPMLLWLWRRPRLIVPHPLWVELDDEQRDSLLLHEVAHYRRGDHYVRWLELLATVLYWWNPLLWWVRREMRSAEEVCCDAWVTWAAPQAARAYLNALLNVIDFAAARRPRPVVAPLGSGMGQFSELKRRFVMIQEGKVSRTLSWGNLAAVVGLGALLLPVTLATAQPEATRTADPTSVYDSSNVGTAGADTTAGATPQEGVTSSGTTATRSDDPKLRQELQRARVEVEQLAAQLAAAQARLAHLEAAMTGPGAGNRLQNGGSDSITSSTGRRTRVGAGASSSSSRQSRPMTTTPGGYPVGTTSGPAGASRGYAPYSRDPSGVGAPGYGERSSMSDATGRYGESADWFRRSYRAGFASATDQPMPGMSGAPGPTASADQVNVTALLKAVQDLQATVSQLQRDVQALRQGAESTTKP